ncbi:MAG TPA: tRNA (adenosine(37)-N6)-threonylcarbamoyltransferase complex ATPase subunit type 1 TsaE [Bacillota bacterium]|nr:tRNA (adenosine(37)-N6)-threonylcarbamoyltransferase complex ATPase subunit type 1 TsaE [Bacillota bacterium]HQC36203.1 tRNA (adenosine(37)-N6)-threonylcarbamoyltransferase complex ATPase subunit type 1 TsaE [Bacillota bacterium]
MKKTLLFKNEKETQSFGRELAASLKPGDVVALSGDLGTGKTALTRAVARGLGIDCPVTSPTFTIVQEYEGGRLPLYHFDIYRVHDEEELFEIGIYDYLHGDGVCVIEWADLAPEIIPDKAIRIGLSYGESEEERICEIC